MYAPTCVIAPLFSSTSISNFTSAFNCTFVRFGAPVLPPPPPPPPAAAAAAVVVVAVFVSVSHPVSVSDFGLLVSVPVCVVSVVLVLSASSALPTPPSAPGSPAPATAGVSGPILGFTHANTLAGRKSPERKKYGDILWVV
ncbi:hypothetical protein APHAL10511_002941 [Amanita phalloides]|nr:hypothetical protein APHAL10511_002941 [Amanita phalloides]